MSKSRDFIANRSPHSQSFSYDNCIVREHEDSDASNESVFSWRKVDVTETSSFSESSSEEEDGGPRPSEVLPAIEGCSDLKVTAKESFVLILGFLNKAEPYLIQHEQLHKELKLLELVLVNNAENFGYNVRPKRCNGEVGKRAKTSTETRKNDTLLRQTQAERMNESAESSSDVVEEGRRRSGRTKNATNKKIATEEKPEAKKQLRKRASKSLPPSDSRRVSKRVKHNTCNDRMSIVASKIKQAAQIPVKRPNLKFAGKGKAGQSGGDTSKLDPGVSKGTRRRSSPIKTSERRKLYCSETWMETLSSILTP